MQALKFVSQNEATCGTDHVEYACGVVALSNSLIILNITPFISPQQIIETLSTISPMSLAEMHGLPSEVLLKLCNAVCETRGYKASLVHECSNAYLKVGALMYVSSIALKNCQGGAQFESADVDSHIVTIEQITNEGLVLISPDCRKSGKGSLSLSLLSRAHISILRDIFCSSCTHSSVQLLSYYSNAGHYNMIHTNTPRFRHDVWGRLKVSFTQLDDVWQTVRHNGEKTTRVAVFLH
jgi:hypothetical protein